MLMVGAVALMVRQGVSCTQRRAEQQGAQDTASCDSASAGVCTWSSEAERHHVAISLMLILDGVDIGVIEIEAEDTPKGGATGKCRVDSCDANALVEQSVGL